MSEISLAPWKKTSVTDLADLLAEMKMKIATSTADSSESSSTAAGVGSSAADSSISSLSKRLAEEDMLPAKSVRDVRALVYLKRYNDWGGIALVLEDSEEPITSDEIKEMLKLLRRSGITPKELCLKWKNSSTADPDLVPATDPRPTSPRPRNIDPRPTSPRPRNIDLNLIPVIDYRWDPELQPKRSGTFSLSDLISLPDPDVEVSTGRSLPPLPEFEDVAEATVNLLEDGKEAD